VRNVEQRPRVNLPDPPAGQSGVAEDSKQPTASGRGTGAVRVSRPGPGPLGSGQPAVVEVYTLAGCGHCARALGLLRRRGIAFTEVRGDARPRFRGELLDLTGRSTVPQILVDGAGIGGASDLVRLDRRGLLEPLVRRQPFPRAVMRRRLSLTGLVATVVGGGCGPWRYAVELVDRDGSVLRHLPAPEVLARELSAAFNAGDEPFPSEQPGVTGPSDHPHQGRP